MATPPLPNLTPPIPGTAQLQEAARLVEATRAQTVAILTAALIGAAGRAFSIEETLALSRDIHFSMYPAKDFGVYEAWKKTFDAKKVII
jgi:hypothetical protein